MKQASEKFCILATILILGPLALSADAAKVGLEGRVPWTSSRIAGTPEPPRPFVLKQVFEEWTHKNPVDVAFVPEWNRAVVLHVDGTWVSFSDRGDGSQAVPLIDLQSLGKHPGLLRAYGFTFHPDGQKNRQVFVAWSQRMFRKGNNSAQWYLSRFRLSQVNPPRIDPDSEEVLLNMEMAGHNGGCLKFGPDGYLYVSIGDGRPPSPPDGLKTGQDLSDLRANILRIDVDRAADGRPYAIPKDNPFVGLNNARPEIWAYGFRNPWRMCFSPFDGSLWLGDVGWEMWEMVHRVVKGGNYGWSIVEGTQSIHPELPRGPTPIRPAVVQHPHTESRSVTGGFVYRGSAFPELKQAYIYGDYVTGKIWALWHDGQSIRKHEEIAHAPVQIITFAEDGEGELLVVDYEGRYHRMERNPQTDKVSSFPRKLSETGLFASAPEQVPAPGVIPYDLRQGMWSDGAVIHRFIGVPDAEKIGVHARNDIAHGQRKGEWSFPANTVFARTVSLPMDARSPDKLRKLETQVLHFDGKNWQPYNYIWNDGQTDAVLADSKGGDRTLKVIDRTGATTSKKWHFASRTECVTCHIIRTGGVQGFKDWQLNTDFSYGRTTANQLATLNHIKLFEQPASARKVGKGSISPDVSLEVKARAYLDANCAHCHQNQGGGGATIDLRYQASLEETEMLNPPSLGGFAMTEPRIIQPGDPAASILYYRMAKLGPGHMPFLGSRDIDHDGLSLFREWMAGMPRQGEPSPPKGSPTMDNLDAWLSSTETALALSIHLHEADPTWRRKHLAEIVERATRHPDSNIRDLFEVYVPEDQRTPRLGLSVDPRSILSLKGNPQNGRRLFFSDQGNGCAACHQVGGQGVDFGPDLSDIGDRHPRGRLLDSVLNPNWTLAKGYVSMEVETDSDFSYTGFIHQRTDKALTLNMPGGKTQTIPASEITSVRPVDLSAMPAGLLQNFTAQEAADLLTFLASLKKQKKGEAARGATPLKSLQDDRFTHSIQRVREPIKIDGRLNEEAWKNANPVGAFHFPWEDGNNEQTESRLLWDDTHLYVSFRCTDAMILGERTIRDSPVYRDDCVEVFLSPNPVKLEQYFNIEMSVNEAWLDAFHPQGAGSKEDWNPEGIRIASSVDGTQNIEADRDRSWTLEAAIPFAAFGRVAKNTPPRPGDGWRLNLNRLNYDRPSGHTRLQRSQWAPGSPDNPGFHAPEYFGKVVFTE